MSQSSCLIIAGEKSGEEHARTFLPELIKTCPDTKFFGVGGEEFKELGVELIYELKDFSSMGYSEVFEKIPFYINAEKKLLELVQQRNCKTAILIDFQGFNLKIAKKLKVLNVNVLYYVAPQAWSWKAYRAKTIEKCVHTLFSIVPFEKQWFAQKGVKRIKSVPHPVYQTYKGELDSLPPRSFDELQNRKIQLLLLPGSRNSEVSRLLPVFLESARKLKNEFNIEVSIVKTPSVKSAYYEYYKNDFNKIYEAGELSAALKNADVCMASSGTVTLSTALFELPTVVCYKVSLLNEFIARNFVEVYKYISLANIVKEKFVFPELLQDDANIHLITHHLKRWLTDKQEYERIKSELSEVKGLITGEDFSVPEYMAKVINENS
jgi:lipid-A-disaccharide synthase